MTEEIDRNECPQVRRLKQLKDENRRFTFKLVQKRVQAQSAKFLKISKQLNSEENLDE